MSDEFVMNDATSREVPRVGPPGYDEVWDRKEGRYFDKRGNELSLREVTPLFEDKEYASVARDTVGVYLVSTVWLGLDHSFGDSKPVLFETMVFNKSMPKPPCPPSNTDFYSKEFQEWLEEYPDQTSASDVECERYHTEDEALAGHRKMVERVGLLVDFTTPEEDDG